MDKYHVKLTNRALKDLDSIYDYIGKVLLEPKVALDLILIETSILSLEMMPYRCSERKVGAYSNRGYRQLFVKNFTIIYRIDEINKCVIIICVYHSSSNF